MALEANARTLLLLLGVRVPAPDAAQLSKEPPFGEKNNAEDNEQADGANADMGRAMSQGGAWPTEAIL